MTTIIIDVAEPSVDSVCAEDARLVGLYLEELSRAGGDRTQVTGEGRAALDALMAGAAERIQAMVAGHLRDRFGGAIPDGLRDECNAQGYIAALESLEAYDGRVPFSGWMVSRAGGPAREAMLQAVDVWSGVADMPMARRRVVKLAATMWVQLTEELGREPDVTELQDALLEQSVEYHARRRSSDAAALDGDELRQAMLAKARRRGTLAAIRDVSELLPHIRATPVSLGDGWEAAVAAGATASTPGDDLGELGRVAFGGMSEDDVDAVMSVLHGEREQDERTTHLLAEVGERVMSPVARFAFLSPTLALQFEDASASRVEAARAVARRR